MAARDASRSAMTAAGRTLAALAPLGFPFVVPLAGGRLTDRGGGPDPVLGRVPARPTPRTRRPCWRAWPATLRLPDRPPGERVSPPSPCRPGRALPAAAPVRHHAGDLRGERRPRRTSSPTCWSSCNGASISSTCATTSGSSPPIVAMPGAGEALASLLRAEWTSAADAEAFQHQAGLRADPEARGRGPPAGRIPRRHRRAAIAPDVPVRRVQRRDVRCRARGRSRGTLPVHGLVQDVTVPYEEDEDGVAWRKQPRHGRAAWIPGAEEASDLLASLPADDLLGRRRGGHRAGRRRPGAPRSRSA